jgi:hypothetical protein
VALSTGDRQAGDSNRVAAKRVSIVLGLEEQGRKVWPTLREPENTRANPTDEQRESTVGSTTHSEPFNAPNWVQLSNCRRSVGYIIATSAEQRENPHPSAGMTTPEYIEDRGVVLTTVVSSCLRHQAVTTGDEDQEDCG